MLLNENHLTVCRSEDIIIQHYKIVTGKVLFKNQRALYK